jgi:hypothetical protein
MDDKSIKVTHELARHTVYTVVTFCEKEIPCDEANKTDTAHTQFCALTICKTRRRESEDSGTNKIPPSKVSNFSLSKAVADNTDKCGIRSSSFT